jgi:hypothetical protein
MGRRARLPSEENERQETKAGRRARRQFPNDHGSRPGKYARKTGRQDRISSHGRTATTAKPFSQKESCRQQESCYFQAGCKEAGRKEGGSEKESLTQKSCGSRDQTKPAV